MAELMGIKFGLRCCWDLGVRNVVIENDCLEAVDLIEDETVDPQDNEEVVDEIREMLKREWDVQLCWCRREANKVADSLAKRALKIGAGVVQFVDVPLFIFDLIEQEKLLTS